MSGSGRGGAKPQNTTLTSQRRLDENMAGEQKIKKASKHKRSKNSQHDVGGRKTNCNERSTNRRLNVASNHNTQPHTTTDTSSHTQPHTTTHNHRHKLTHTTTHNHTHSFYLWQESDTLTLNYKLCVQKYVDT